jgi:exopolyphosphatase/guanosine-5'-triphosphate,3'-diphosphate pyrophosphatase
VTHVKAVGTSALREATNRDAVLRSIAKATGIEISIIGGEEEARLIHQAAKQVVNLKSKVALLIDIGGGSVEVVLADDTTVLATESYSMGSVRLLKILDEKAGEERFNQLVTEYVDATQRRLAQEIGNQKNRYLRWNGREHRVDRRSTSGFLRQEQQPESHRR